jgi:hypothetical protein
MRSPLVRNLFLLQHLDRRREDFVESARRLAGFQSLGQVHRSKFGIARRSDGQGNVKGDARPRVKALREGEGQFGPPHRPFKRSQKIEVGDEPNRRSFREPELNALDDNGRSGVTGPVGSNF